MLVVFDIFWKRGNVKDPKVYCLSPVTEKKIVTEGTLAQKMFSFSGVHVKNIFQQYYEVNFPEKYKNVND